MCCRSGRGRRGQAAAVPSSSGRDRASVRILRPLCGQGSLPLFAAVGAVPGGREGFGCRPCGKPVDAGRGCLAAKQPQELGGPARLLHPRASHADTGAVPRCCPCSGPLTPAGEATGRAGGTVHGSSGAVVTTVVVIACTGMACCYPPCVLVSPVRTLLLIPVYPAAASASTICAGVTAQEHALAVLWTIRIIVAHTHYLWLHRCQYWTCCDRH